MSVGFWTQHYENYYLTSKTFMISNTHEQNCSGKIAILLEIQDANTLWSLLVALLQATITPTNQCHVHKFTHHQQSTFYLLVETALFLRFQDRVLHVVLLSATGKTFRASVDLKFTALVEAYYTYSHLP